MRYIKFFIVDESDQYIEHSAEYTFADLLKVIDQTVGDSQENIELLYPAADRYDLDVQLAYLSGLITFWEATFFEDVSFDKNGHIVCYNMRTARLIANLFNLTTPFMRRLQNPDFMDAESVEYYKKWTPIIVKWCSFIRNITEQY